MNRRLPSDPEHAALAAFQASIERFSGFSRDHAINHNLGRNVRVLQLLGYAALMRQRGPLSGFVECGAAKQQNFSSKQTAITGARQAAHFLPGQIRIGGREIWDFETDPKTRASIEFMFGEVEHLPLPFNQADSAAEASGSDWGLCAALARACINIQHAEMGAYTGRLPVGRVQTAYQIWQAAALVGLQTAIANKGEKPGVPDLIGDRFQGYTLENISQRSNAGLTLQNRSDSLRILEYYAAHQQQCTWEWMIGSCKWALREVDPDFHVEPVR